MFPPMRRKNQALSHEEITAILYRGTSGVLALSGNDGYPYAVPISYVYDGETLYFHCAKTGHKLDAIARNCKASFCVIDQDQVMPEEYTSYYKSVIAFGKIRILEDAQEKRAALEKLAVKYAPEDAPANREHMMDKEWTSLCMLELHIEHMTGKEAIELVRKHQSTTP